jgi:hypothetical protein
MSRSQPAAPSALQDRAIADLRFIRETLTATTAFTALSGLAFIAMGVGALLTVALTYRMADPLLQVAGWVADAGVSVGMGALGAVWKAQKTGQSLRTGPFRRFLLGLAPAIFAGAVLTLLAVSIGQYTLLPPLWLLLYGTGLLAAGAFSIRVVPLLGASFLALGTVAAFVPASGPTLLAVGFGGLHLAFGYVIARHHGG